MTTWQTLQTRVSPGDGITKRTRSIHTGFKPMQKPVKTGSTLKPHGNLQWNTEPGHESTGDTRAVRQRSKKKIKITDQRNISELNMLHIYCIFLSIIEQCV